MKLKYRGVRKENLIIVHTKEVYGIFNHVIFLLRKQTDYKEH